MEKDNSIYQKILTEHFQGGGLDTERGRERRSQQNESEFLMREILQGLPILHIVHQGVWP